MESGSELDRIRWTLTLLFLGALLLALYFVFRPFIVPISWSIVLVTITWPINRALMNRMPRYPSVSAALMTIFVAVVIGVAVVPLIAAVTSEVQDLVHQIKEQATTPIDRGAIVDQIPFLPQSWRNKIIPYLEKLSSNREEISRLLLENQLEVVSAFKTVATKAASFVLDLIVLLFTVFVLYRNGATVAQDVVLAGRRIGGNRFERLLHEMKDTVKAAVYGTLATAVAQGFLAALGYLAAGAPVPILLGAFTMLVALVPFGPPFVYLPAALFVGVEQSALAGILLAAWGTLVVSTIDNVLRPLFISQATSMPLILVFFGVLGGIITFGFIGTFIGPAVIAIALALWKEWTLDTVEQS